MVITFADSVAGDTMKCIAGELHWSGGALSGTPLDQKGNGTEAFTSSPTDTTTVPLTANGDLGIGMYFQTANDVIGPGAGYTLLNPADTDMVLEWKTVSGGSGATLSATVALGGTDNGNMYVAAIKHP